MRFELSEYLFQIVKVLLGTDIYLALILYLILIQFFAIILIFLTINVHFYRELQSQIEIFKQKKATESSIPKKEVSAASQDLAKSGTLKYQMIYHPDKAKVQDIARMSNLEKRLGHLESLIGISDDSTAKCSQVR